jgi:Zn-dependent M28 family amino/carboxypeptidase
MRRLGLEPMGDAGSYVQTIATPPLAGQQAAGRTWNAVGRLPGRDNARRSEVILISAHIDHLGNRAGAANAAADTIYNGADDDASGSVAVLELMDALAGGPRPRRTLVFALFGSEERGGAGSRHFADQPTVPLAQIIANLQFEMIGRPDGEVPPRTLWLTGYERSNLGPTLARRGARLRQDPHPEMSFFTRSDNIQFARRGVVAHTVSSYGLHKEYHTPADELARIDFTHMTEAIASLVNPIRWLANASFTPAWNPGGQPPAK